MTLFYKHYALETFITKSRCTTRWTMRSTFPWYLFNSSIKEAGYINVTLGHLPSERTSKRLSKEEASFDCWNISWIWSFGNAHNIRIMAKLGGVTHWAEPPERPEGMRKNRTALGRLGLIVRPEDIRLDGLSWWIAWEDK